MSSKTHSAGVASAKRTERGAWPGSRMTISPGWTSRTYSAPTMSRAAVSDERHQPDVGVVAVPQAVVRRRRPAVRGSRPRTSGRNPNGSRTPMTRRSSRITRLYAPRTRGRTRWSASTVSAAGSSARSAVSSSVSVEAGRRARPPRSCSSSSRVLTRLPLWPMASARRGPSRYVGWAFSQIVEPVVE